MRRNKPSRRGRAYKRSHQLVIHPFADAKRRKQGALPPRRVRPLQELPEKTYGVNAYTTVCTALLVPLTTLCATFLAVIALFFATFFAVLTGPA